MQTLSVGSGEESHVRFVSPLQVLKASLQKLVSFGKHVM